MDDEGADNGCRISRLIAPSFYPLWADIFKGRHTRYWIEGGRGSTKSSLASLAIVGKLLRDPDVCAVVFRKVANTLRDSVFEQIGWAIDQLHLTEYFWPTKTPLEYVYTPTGQKIIFRGMDDPRTRTKSIKAGGSRYFGLAWFEELDEFAGLDEIRMAEQSIMRGGERFTYLYSFNPPRSVSSWVNIDAGTRNPGRLVFKSDYRTVPRAWLGEQFIADAELLRQRDPESYRHEYLGVPTGTGGAVFTRCKARRMSDAEVASFSNRRYGLDFGYAIDPLAFVAANYDRKNRRIAVFDEIYGIGLDDDDVAERIKKRNVGHAIITADCAEPKAIDRYRRHGLLVNGAVKGADSVANGVKWLQHLDIDIDPDRAPNAWREFSTYEYSRNRSGQFMSKYPDANNHAIDALRYACEADSMAASGLLI